MFGGPVFILSNSDADYPFGYAYPAASRYYPFYDSDEIVHPGLLNCSNQQYPSRSQQYHNLSARSGRRRPCLNCSSVHEHPVQSMPRYSTPQRFASKVEKNKLGPPQGSKPISKVIPIQTGTDAPHQPSIPVKRYSIQDYHQAATKIQRAFRNYLSEKAARAQILQQLEILNGIRAQAEQLHREYVDGRGVINKEIVFQEGSISINHLANRDLLEYENSLTQLLLKTDSVQSFDNAQVKNERKSLINFIQGLLDRVDEHRDEQISLRSESLSNASTLSDTEML